MLTAEDAYPSMSEALKKVEGADSKYCDLEIFSEASHGLKPWAVMLLVRHSHEQRGRAASTHALAQLVQGPTSQTSEGRALAASTMSPLLRSSADVRLGIHDEPLGPPMLDGYNFRIWIDDDTLEATLKFSNPQRRREDLRVLAHCTTTIAYELIGDRSVSRLIDFLG